ncbi:hypothetical protein OA089_01200 [bacterium]|nr:hypothetical protein [bacterium]
MKKPANYWYNFSNIKKELNPLIKKLGRFPSSRELKKVGLESLHRHGILRFGGFQKVAKMFNLKYIASKKSLANLKRYNKREV